MPQPRTYSAKDVIFTLGGERIQGFGPGVFLSIAPVEDEVLPSVGVDGEVSIATNINPLRTVTVTLASTSPANDLFSAYARQRRANPATPARVLSVEDLQGSTLLYGPSWVQARTTKDFDRGISTTSWTIGLVEDDVGSNIGGNNLI